ncbi:MAG: alpha/beta fold hydrolase, partial [Pseudomonadota bacterium]
VGIARRLAGYALLAVAFIAGAFGAVAGTLAAAKLADAPAVFLTAGLALAGLLTLALAHLALRLLGRPRRWRPALACGAVLVLAVGLLEAVYLLRPLADAVPPEARALPPGATRWMLPTGSEVAVLKFESRGAVKGPPLLFLHGGPGAYSVALTPTVEALSALAGDGHDVYFYDQIGGGLSARLDDVTQYTLARHLADLDAVVERIGSDRVVLVASSFGASLGASFIARRPERVAAAVFSGSGPLFHPDWIEVSDGKVDDVLSAAERERFSQAIEKPRLLAAVILAQLNPNAAARFAPEAEVGAFFDAVANEFYLSATVCPGADALVTSGGYGFWSNRMTGKSLRSRSDDPRPRLRELTLPVLVLRGVCDYKKEAVAREYAEVFPNARFHALEGAGHMPYLDAREGYLALVRPFLARVRAELVGR